MRTIFVLAVALGVVVVVLWLRLPHSPQVMRSHPPAPAAEEEAGDVVRVPESPLRAARVQTPVLSSISADGAKTGVAIAPHEGRPAPPQAGSEAVSAEHSNSVTPMSIQTRRGGENHVVVGFDEGRDRELAPADTSAGVSDRTPILTAPVIRGLVVPGYPSDAFHLVLDRDALAPTLRVEAAQGRVVLRILVRLDGSVARIEIAASAGIPVLDDAAVQAAQRWQFVPATRDGAPIDAWAVVTVRFMLR